MKKLPPYRNGPLSTPLHRGVEHLTQISRRHSSSVPCKLEVHTNNQCSICTLCGIRQQYLSWAYLHRIHCRSSCFAKRVIRGTKGGEGRSLLKNEQNSFLLTFMLSLWIACFACCIGRCYLSIAYMQVTNFPIWCWDNIV